MKEDERMEERQENHGQQISTGDLLSSFHFEEPVATYRLSDLILCFSPLSRKGPALSIPLLLPYSCLP